MDQQLTGIELEREKLRRKKLLAGYIAMYDIDFYPADQRYYDNYNDCINCKISVEEFKNRSARLTQELNITHTNNSVEHEMTISHDEFDKLINKSGK